MLDLKQIDYFKALKGSWGSVTSVRRFTWGIMEIGVMG